MNEGSAPLVVVMGAAGSGKSTVGPLVAADLHVPFLDGDAFHDGAAVERMRRGLALGDADRAPWLDRLHGVLVAHREAGVVLACSALKPAYRDRLRGELTGVVFVALAVDRAILLARLTQRPGHFAGPALLDSQLHDLDVDGVAVVDGAMAPRAVADAIVRVVGASGPESAPPDHSPAVLRNTLRS